MIPFKITCFLKYRKILYSKSVHSVKILCPGFFYFCEKYAILTVGNLSIQSTHISAFLKISFVNDILNNYDDFLFRIIRRILF